MGGTESIYQFTDVIDFLNFEFESKRLRNQRFSLRAWSRQLGYENPSFVSHILKRQRKLKLDVAEKFANNLKLSLESKRYFELLVLLQNSKTVDEKHLYMELIETLGQPQIKQSQNLSIEAFRVISDWYHTAILELIELRDFQSDPIWIAERLRGEVTPQQVTKAIERLCKLELVTETASGKLKRVKDNPVLLENYIPSEAIRHFHKQMIDKAKEAIEKQDIEDRDLRGSTIAIRKKDYKKIQQIIKEAHAKIVSLAADGNADELYQFNTQLFSLTTKDGKI